MVGMCYSHFQVSISFLARLFWVEFDSCFSIFFLNLLFTEIEMLFQDMLTRFGFAAGVRPIVHYCNMSGLKSQDRVCPDCCIMATDDASDVADYDVDASDSVAGETVRMKSPRGSV